MVLKHPWDPAHPWPSLDSSLSTTQASKAFTMRFSFTKEMDPVSIQNPFNWGISRAVGNQCRGSL